VIAHDPAHFDALRLSGLIHAQTGRFEPLARIEGVQFVSLQKGEPAAQALHPPPGP
jgi:hypothetical protein